MTAAFLAAYSVPYRVDTDTGFQLRSLQQWVRGESPDPGTLRLPDPADLSRDALVWSTWWPPGFPVLYAPLAAAGLSLAGTLRATSLLLFLAGCLGWLRLADRLDLSRPVRLLYALSLAAYAVTVGGAATLPWAEVLTFAAAPWLAAAVLSQARRPSPPLFGIFLAGFALGAAYWLKYTLFLVAIPMAAWLALRLVRGREAAGLRLRLGRVAALGLGFALPVAALFALNLHRSEALAESATGHRASWVAVDPDTADPLPLALAVAGAPGLGLFQNHLWITHGLYFSNARLPWLAGLDSSERLLLKSLLGIPGTIALGWGLLRASRVQDRSFLSLALVVAAGFYLLLTAISALVRYNYLTNEPRFAAGFMPFLHPLLLSGWLAAPARRWGRAAVALVLAVLFAAPLVFAVADFALNQVGDRRALRFRASVTGLFMPEISRRSVPEVRAAVASLLRTPEDVVAVAGPAGWGSSLVLWLDLPGRVFPLTAFSSPLTGRYAAAANLRSSQALETSRDLRVVLMVADELVEADWQRRLQDRFPQARQWHRAPMPEHSNLTVFVSELEAP